MGKTKFSSIAFFISGGLFLGLILKLFIFEFLTVSGPSMTPAVKDGDRIFINKLAYGIVRPYSEELLFKWAEPKKEDIVIYLYDNKIVVKRCVAEAGDLLEFSTESGYTLKTGGKEIPLSETQYFNLKNSNTVPDGYILAIGDNYPESFDSRNYGFVSVRCILGKVICR